VVEQPKCSASDARAKTVTTGEHRLGRNAKPIELVTDDRRRPPKTEVRCYRCARCDTPFRDLRLFNDHLTVK